jgi:virginiamycin A acetyltransferase
MANYIHETAKIAQWVSIEVSSKGTNTYIGKNSFIDDFVKIKHVGGNGDIIIGENVYINSCTVIYSGNGVKIGNNVLFGPNCNLVPVNHNYLGREKTILQQGFLESQGGIIIEDDVCLGANVTILDGSHIKKGAVIGANSLITGVVEAFSINVGTPLVQRIGYR